MCKCGISFALTFFLLNSSFGQEDDSLKYAYQPCPVLLIHGFNSTPETFGAYTHKDEVGDIIKTDYINEIFFGKGRFQ